MATIRVLIVDDHPVYAQGLQALFSHEPDLEVVGMCHDGAGVAAAVGRLRPDVVVLDVQLPIRHGAEVAQEIRISAPSVRILGLSAFGDEDSVCAMIAAGVAGYMLKEAAPQEIARAIRVVAAGESCLAPSVTRKVIERLSHLAPGRMHPPGPDQLSEREFEVLNLIAGGESNKEIGHRLGLSTRTVEHHVLSINRKLGVRDRMQATLCAVRMGLVHIPAAGQAESHLQ